MKIKEIKTKDKHIFELCENLRVEDRREVVSKTGNLDVQSTILKGWLQSDYCKTVLVDNQVAFIYGVISSPDMPNMGSPYMLGTDLLTKVKMPFIRNCKNRISYMEKKYKILFNWIDSRNKLHLRFIKWCGFEIINEKKFNDVLFYGFFKGDKK